MFCSVWSVSLELFALIVGCSLVKHRLLPFIHFFFLVSIHRLPVDHFKLHRNILLSSRWGLLSNGGILVRFVRLPPVLVLQLDFLLGVRWSWLRSPSWRIRLIAVSTLARFNTCLKPSTFTWIWPVMWLNLWNRVVFCYREQINCWSVLLHDL